MKSMKRYEFAIPGAVGYEVIQAENLSAAENIAAKMCEHHTFLGGKVQPMVTEVGKSRKEST